MVLKTTPSVERWRVNPASFVELSVQDRLTEVEVTPVTDIPEGAGGTVGVIEVPPPTRYAATAEAVLISVRAVSAELDGLDS
jgi:hypothetical protein